MNPFILSAYKSPEYFCDRNNETAHLLNALDNQRNITIISQRRMGKTGLIKHVEHIIKQQNSGHIFIYIDILSTQNLQEFTSVLGQEIYKTLEKHNSGFSKKFVQAIKSLRPIISYDPIQQSANLNFDFRNPETIFSGLADICQYLSDFKGNISIAIDEFQQILEYPEQNIEALLRGQFQLLHNTSFIYSGSYKHIMTTMFTDPHRAFFGSAELLNLRYIEQEQYTTFIYKHFREAEKNIDPPLIIESLNWCLHHTFYVQFFFNRIFGYTDKLITFEDIESNKHQILEEQSIIFDNYRKLLSKGQFNLIKAIGKETWVKQPTSSSFIQYYKLGSSSSVAQAFKVLYDKNFVIEEENGYRVGDVFFMRWLERF